MISQFCAAGLRHFGESSAGEVRDYIEDEAKKPEFPGFQKRRRPGQRGILFCPARCNSAARRGEPDLARGFSEFKYISFDVVGTLIDFEGGIKTCLAEIAAEAGVSIDGEAALSLYRQARYMPDAGLFPDDLARVYGT